METRFVVQTLNTVADYVRRVIESDNEYLFAVIDSKTDEHIGNLHIAINRNHNRASIAYFIGATNYWRGGRCVEMLKLSAKYAFDVLKLDRIEGGTYARNVFSLKAMLRAGYKKEGYRPEYVLLNDGTRDGLYLAGMTRKDYEQLYKTPAPENMDVSS